MTLWQNDKSPAGVKNVLGLYSVEKKACIPENDVDAFYDRMQANTGENSFHHEKPKVGFGGRSGGSHSAIQAIGVA